MFMPCSGLTGANLREPIDESVCSWFKGPAFIPYINNLPPLNRNISGPFMMPIVDRYNDRGTIVMGKVESGCCKKGDNIVVMPNKVRCFYMQLLCHGDKGNILPYHIPLHITERSPEGT